MSKIKLALIVFFVLLAGLALWAYLVREDTLKLKTTEGKTLTVRNFVKTATEVQEDSVTLEDNPEIAAILYNANSGIFSVLVHASDQAEYHKRLPLAEARFLAQLGVSKKDACKLLVEVSYDGPLGQIPGLDEISKLSFCK